MAGARQFDEDALLEAVLQTFWRKGWQATTMADLAEAASVQRGSLYHAYGDKQALFLHAFDRYAERFLATARRALTHPSAALALRTFLHTAIRHMRTGHPSRGCLTSKTAAELHAGDVVIRARLAELLAALRTLLIDTLSRPEMTGALRLPPAQAAELLLTFTRGLAVMERIENAPARLRHSADSLVTLLLAEP